MESLDPGVPDDGVAEEGVADDEVCDDEEGEGEVVETGASADGAEVSAIPPGAFAKVAAQMRPSVIDFARLLAFFFAGLALGDWVATDID